MWKDKALSYGADILLSAYAVYLQILLERYAYSEISGTSILI